MSFPTPPTVTITPPTASHGRALHATRTLAPGSPIAVFDAPLLALPDAAHLATTCSWCLATATAAAAPVPRRCTGCGGAAAYCSRACQRAAWAAGHRGECRVLGAVAARGRPAALVPTPVRALVQLLLRLDRGDGDGAAVREALRGLEGNVDAFRAAGGGEGWCDIELQAVGACGMIDAAAETKKKKTKQTTSSSGSGEAAVAGGTDAERLRLAEEILCKIQTNAFDRTELDIDQSGIFLDPVLAMVNHSCVPNAFVNFSGRKAILRAEAEIKKGEEIRISYVDYNLPKSARHDGLRLYHFTCDCLRCKEDLEVYDVCKLSPVLGLNRFSLFTDLEGLRNPPVDLTLLRRCEFRQQRDEALEQCSESAGKQPNDPLNYLKFRWEICEPLAKAKAWALEPLAQTLIESAPYFVEQGKFEYALCIACFIALNCDPYRDVAPFKPWRLKTLFSIARLLSNTAEREATSYLDTGSNLDRKLKDTLQKTDQLSMCQAILAMVESYGPMAHSKEWEVYIMADETLQDIKRLPGREKETAILETLMTDPTSPEALMFFDMAAIKPAQELSRYAQDILTVNFRT